MKSLAVPFAIVFVAASSAAPFSKMPTGKALEFMQRFGYLEKGDGDSDALYSEEGIESAIRSVQRFGGIPQTGIIDSETVKLMESPRCGVPDVVRNRRARRFVLGPQGWNKRRITYFIANWSPNLGERAVAKNIQTALDVWGKYARLSFGRSTDLDRADIVVTFTSGHHGDSLPFDGPGATLAHAFFPNEGSSLGGDVHFDNDENWTSRRAGDGDDGIDFFSVAVHELGHSLGLSHSSVRSSVMFPYYKGYEEGVQFSLDYDDILGVYEMYIRRYVGGDEEFPEDFDTSTTESTTTTTMSAPTTVGVTYEGDFETVDDHRAHETTPRTTQATVPPSSAPDICDGHFDAVATLRNELFIFKGAYIWRLKDRFRLEPGYPAPIRQMFPKLPPSVTTIHAAYERPDGGIVLFTGSVFWVYDGVDFTEGSPRPLTDYGLPEYVDRVDAVQVWAKNGKTYLYKGDRFWRYNETSKSVDPGYPRHMERWRGVPEDLDAATTWKDGYTYFFKGKLFWKFDNDWVVATDNSPLPSPQTWLGCPEDLETTFPRYR